MNRDKIREELRELRILEPVLYGIVMGHGTPLTIASAAGMTVGDIRDDIERLHRAGRITKLYGKSWVINAGHRDAGYLKELRSGAKEIKERK